MANQWLRLWHDMPTDPKWRTIARVSGQHISEVIAVYTHLLVAASNATERGRTQSFNCEDVAAALDLETGVVEAIHAAMQGRVLDGDRLKGWADRQPIREDGAADRSRAWREKKEAEKAAAFQALIDGKTLPNADERNRSLDKDTEEIKKKKEMGASGEAGGNTPPPPKPSRKKPKTEMPVDFGVSERVTAWAAGKGFDRLPEHLDSFRLKVAANSYTYADWDAALMNAISADWARLRQVPRFGPDAVSTTVAENPQIAETRAAHARLAAVELASPEARAAAKARLLKVRQDAIDARVAPTHQDTPA